MNKTEIFDLFSANLHMLVDNGLLPGLKLKYEKTYICPICLEQFNDSDLDISKPNHLTLEDNPPKSLGGKADLLTCKKCNNEAGYKIDAHLHEKLKRLDQSQYIPNTKFEITIEQGDLILHGTADVIAENVINLKVSNKNNDKKIIERFNNNIAKSEEAKYVMANPRQKKRLDYGRIPIAMLKINYLLVFRKFGYLFIFDNRYNIFRKQILNPHYNLAIQRFWTEFDVDDKYIGTHLLENPGLQCICSFFELKTLNFKSKFLAFFPFPYPFKSHGDIIETLDGTVNKYSFSTLQLKVLPTNYLFDIVPNIILYNHLEQVRLSQLGYRKWGQ